MKKELGVKNCTYPMPVTIVGATVEAYCDETLVAEGDIVDFTRVHPILFAMYDKSYFELGERFADAWSIGKALIK